MTRSSRVLVGFVVVAIGLGFAHAGAFAADAKAGEAIYTAQCAKCHGDKGAGDGPQGQKLKDKPSNWTVGGGGLKGMTDQQIADSITKGGKGMGKSAAMPAFPKLSEAEVANVVAYVKTLAK